MVHVWIIEWQRQEDKKWLPYSFWLTQKAAKQVKRDLKKEDPGYWGVRKYVRED